ncbi:MAG: LuxR C-terminal-related transcriptional regulator, partial [Sandaracinaceae bacterium]
ARRTARLLRALPMADRLARARTLELAVRAALSRGRRVDATTALRELRAIARGSTSSLRAALLLAEGRVALATQRAEAARDAFERSIDLFRAAGVDVEAEAARTDLARALSALGDREGAAVESQAALAYFEPRGARDEVERARARAASTEAQADPSGAGRSQAGLSRREREVLRLLCDGRSNREIGRTLHISELTAKRHVQNILSKLDVPTRAAAAAFAARHGLA